MRSNHASDLADLQLQGSDLTEGPGPELWHPYYIPPEATPPMCCSLSGMHECDKEAESGMFLGDMGRQWLLTLAPGCPYIFAKSS